MSIASPPSETTVRPKYDENLEENAFFQNFRSSFSELFEKTISEGWLIAVPREDSLPPELNLRPEDVSRHIFIPDEEGREGKYYSLADKRLLISERNQIDVFDANGKLELSRSILFSEVFYNDDLIKYKVICLDGYLGEDPRFSVTNSRSILKLSSLSECIRYLFDHVEVDILRKIEANCSQFDKKSIESLLLTSFKKVKHTSKPVNLVSLKLALETYILDIISGSLINDLKNTYMDKNAALNRSVKSIAINDIFGSEWTEDAIRNSILKSKSELGQLDQYSTPLDKLECLYRALNCFDTLESSDELLQTLISVICKNSVVKDWYSQFIYMKDYRFSDTLKGGEYDYLLASLEAALEHLITDIPNVSPSLNIQSDNPNILKLFSAVKESDFEYVSQTLNSRISSSMDPLSVMEAAHHPLCNCGECSRKYNDSSINYQENHFGFTLLHIAAMNGDSKMVDILLNTFKADPTIVDIKSRTPLHLASQYGRQNVILLILQSPLSRSILNSHDQDGRTPIHLASMYGHESSSKAILYYAEHQSYPLQIDAQDKFGDTALHLSSSNGYKSIVNLLLEYSANSQMRNNRGLTARDVSLCSGIQNLIQSCETKEFVDCFTRGNFVLDNKGNSETLMESPLKEREIHSSKSDKFFKSIMMGDLQLACHYLGINYYNETLRSRVLYQSSCYPICGGCDNCSDLLNAPPSSVKEELQRPSSPPLKLNSANNEGKTGVHVGAQLGQADIVQLLLNLGAEAYPIARDTGETPLHLACQNGHLGVVLVFAQNDSQFREHLDIKDKMGNTPLQYAAMSGHYEIVLKLLRFGASVKMKNNAGHSALDVAKHNDNSTLQLLFKKYS